MRKKHYYVLYHEGAETLLIRSKFQVRQPPARRCICGHQEISAWEWILISKDGFHMVYYCIDCLKRKLLQAKISNKAIDLDEYARRHLLQS